MKIDAIKKEQISLVAEIQNSDNSNSNMRLTLVVAINNAVANSGFNLQDEDNKQKLISMIMSAAKDVLDNETSLEEMSSMSAGHVQGPAGKIKDEEQETLIR